MKLPPFPRKGNLCIYTFMDRLGCIPKLYYMEGEEGALFGTLFGVEGIVERIRGF